MNKVERQHGAALMVSIIVTLMMASTVLIWATQQLLSQHDSLQRQKDWLTDQQRLDRIFNQHAQDLVEGLDAVMSEQEGEFWIETTKVNCLLSELSQCWEVRINRYSDNRWYERTLLIPDKDCAAPYWVAGLSKRGRA